MSQQRVQKTRPDTTTDEEIPEGRSPAEHPAADALKEHSDELLDEIDSLLEENAEEFVRNYQQKGGE